MEAENHKIEWLEFDLLLEYPEIDAKSFLRHGGTSKGPYHSLNGSHNVGDHLENVKSNRELIKDILQAPKIIFANQSHETEMIKINGDENKIPNADILYTTKTNIALAITHADCQAAIIFDPVKKVLAIVHAGWRGLVGGIYEKCINGLKEFENCKPSDLIVCVSPCLCAEHFEFQDYQKHFPEKYFDFKDKNNHFNFSLMAKSDLIKVNIKEKNIEFSDICTFCNKDDYFSYRRDKKTGRNVTVAYLRD
jgi:purine-nucleoside/S-methyl-5'-thioadenosine phosphorylase / adenosine deaminase